MRFWYLIKKIPVVGFWHRKCFYYYINLWDFKMEGYHALWSNLIVSTVILIGRKIGQVHNFKLRHWVQSTMSLAEIGCACDHYWNPSRCVYVGQCLIKLRCPMPTDASRSRGWADAPSEMLYRCRHCHAWRSGTTLGYAGWPPTVELAVVIGL